MHLHPLTRPPYDRVEHDATQDKSSLMIFPALDDRALAETWASAWSALGHAPPAGLRQDLLRAWSGPQRYYHDLRHLRECLAL